MKIGLASIYTWRPHVEQLVYISELLRSAGHETVHLMCAGALPQCYNRAFKGAGKITGCSTCMLGSLASYEIDSLTSLRRSQAAALPLETKDAWAASSSYTLHRLETVAERGEPAVVSTRASLHETVEIAYGSALHWIAAERLDAVFCFNGRMEATRAIIEACRSANIPFVTVERPWFSHGLHLTPNDSCLGLQQLHRMERQYADRPLTGAQASMAAGIGALRFLRRNDLEWRRFNTTAAETVWPVAKSGTRVLVLPGTRAEWEGHPDWESGWPDLTQAIDSVLEHLRVPPEAVVVRNHPNWSTKLGQETGWRAERHYTAWAQRIGAHMISSDDTASTDELIRACDVVIVNGGSAAIQGGLLGKRVVSVAPSPYAGAGFAAHPISPADLDTLDTWPSREDIVRLTLRYIYTHFFRFPQYVQYVRAKSTTDYVYRPGADVGRLERLIRTGVLEPDDSTFAADDTEESRVVSDILQEHWESYSEIAGPELTSAVPIRRRFGLRWLDRIRARLPRGDQW